MKIAIVGGTGRTGLQAIKVALEKDWEVVAVVRSPEKLAEIVNPKLQVRKADILDAESLMFAFDGCEAVVSCIGAPMNQAWPWCTVTLYSESARAMVEAMREKAITRGIFISSACSTYERSNPWLVEWLAKPLLIGRHLADMKRMESYLKEECNDIEYTVVKPPGLQDAPDKPEKKLLTAEEEQFVHGGTFEISREAVARFMLDCIESGQFSQKCVAIGMEK